MNDLSITRQMTEEKTNILKKLSLCAHDFKVDTLYWDHLRLEPHENDLRNYPAPWIKKTIELLKIIDAKTVIEIGSTRMEMTQSCINYYNNCDTLTPAEAPSCCQDGHSTHFWANEGFDTYTVDIDDHCRQMLESQYMHHIKTPMPENLHIHIEDGIEFLTNFNKPIDFLFLDGWDVGSDQYAERHLEAFQSAEDKLSENHIVSVDDTDFTAHDGGKDKLLTPYLIDHGYIKLLWGRQIVFYKI
jgi:hypothetical protein